MQLNKKPTEVEVSLNTVYFLTFWGSQSRARFTLWALLEVHIDFKAWVPGAHQASLLDSTLLPDIDLATVINFVKMYQV